MGRRGRTQNVEINIQTDIKAYAAAVAKIPGVSEKEAAKAAKRFTAQIKRGQIKAALEAEKAAKSSAIAWEDEFDKAGKGIAAGFAAVFAGIGAAAAATAEINEARSEMINLSEATDIALDTLAGIEAAANRAGVPVSEVTGAFEDFGEVLFDFQQGGGRAEEALQQLGFESENMEEAMADVDGTLRKVIRDMVAMEDGANKTAVAQQIFGDAGNRLNAILGDAALEDYIALAEAYGTVIDEQAVTATEDWNAALADAKGVIAGATAELADLLDLGGRLRVLTEIFKFFSEGAAGSLDLVLGKFSQLGESLSALADRDFERLIEIQKEGVDGLLSFDTGLLKNVNSAALATAEFIDMREALNQSTEAAAGTTTELADLARVEEDAAKAAKEAAAEEKRLAGERTKAARERDKQARAAAAEAAKFAAQRAREFDDIVSATEQLSDISRDALSDQRTGTELVNLALLDQLAAIDEIEETLGKNANAQLARDQVRERSIREIQELQLQQIAELDVELQDAADSSSGRAEMVRGDIQKNFNLAAEAFRNLSSAADAFLQIQMDALAEVGRAQADVVDERNRQTADAQQRLAEAMNETQRARALADLLELGAAEEKSEKILAIQQEQSNKIFRARQTLEIANITISGASAAIAALGPPPVGAGPILGGLLALTVGAATAGEIALVKAQKPPQFDAGFPGFTMASDNFQATLRNGESVLNQAATDSMGGPAAIQQINETRGGGGGGRMEVVLEMNNREVGRAIVEEMGAGRELDREITKRARVRARPGVRPVYAGR